MPSTQLWKQLGKEPIHDDIVNRIHGLKSLRIGCGRSEILSAGKVDFYGYSGTDILENLMAENSEKYPGRLFVRWATAALLKDGATAVAVAGGLGVAFFGMSPDSWWEFAFAVIAFMSLFAILLTLLSRAARAELCILKRVLLSRLGPRFSRHAK